MNISSFVDVGAKWLSDKKFAAVNIISSATLWSLWKLRNEKCFQNVGWTDVRLLLWKIVGRAQNWQILCPPNSQVTLLAYISNLKDLAKKNPKTDNGFGVKKNRAHASRNSDEKPMEMIYWSAQLKEMEAALAV